MCSTYKECCHTLRNLCVNRPSTLWEWVEYSHARKRTPDDPGVLPPLQLLAEINASLIYVTYSTYATYATFQNYQIYVISLISQNELA